MTCFDCTAPATYTNRSDERFCATHGAAHLLRVAATTEADLAAHPDWPTTMVDGLAARAAEARATAARLSAP